MNRRIDIRFAAVGGVRHVTSVTTVAASGSRTLYDVDRDSLSHIYETAALVEMLLKAGTWSISFPEMLDRAPMFYDSGVTWKRLVAFRTDLTIEEVGPMNPLDLARALRTEFASGTCDIESGEFWFDPASALGSLLLTTPERGRFEVAATLVDGMLVLNPRLTEFLTDACPAWSEVFNMVAGRLVIMDAALMTGDTIERLEMLGIREGVTA